MSCYLLFISDILKATIQNTSVDCAENSYFVLESRNLNNIEFQNVRYMEFHAGEYQCWNWSILAEYLFYRVCGTIVHVKYLLSSSFQVFDSEVQRPNAPYEFTLDDGTATIVITCSSRIRNRGDAELLKVGSIVTVIGKAQIQKYCRVVQCIGYSIFIWRRSHMYAFNII